MIEITGQLIARRLEVGRYNISSAVYTIEVKGEIEILYTPTALDKKLEQLIGYTVEITEIDPIAVDRGLLRQFTVRRIK